MFNQPARILAHKSVLNKGNYAAGEYIITSRGLLKRFCPHRMYPIQDTGSFSQGNLVCNFHGFEWSSDGTPINNNRLISCGQAEIGMSGLMFKDFTEPDHKWVYDLAKETELEYSHCTQGSSDSSWLWLMEIQADLLHIRSGKGSIHPDLSSITCLDDVRLEQGDGWAFQTCSTGWWLCIYPYTFIEWSPGCLAINYTTPRDFNDEFKFDWISQFYYNPIVDQEKRNSFQRYFHDVFLEDVQAVGKQRGKYFPLMNSSSRLEDHCIHFGEWYRKNVRKDND